jgi:hypothetical protein
MMTGMVYMSRMKMCLDGQGCMADEVNRSFMDKTVPKRNETESGVVENDFGNVRGTDVGFSRVEGG